MIGGTKFCLPHLGKLETLEAPFKTITPCKPLHEFIKLSFHLDQLGNHQDWHGQKTSESYYVTSKCLVGSSVPKVLRFCQKDNFQFVKRVSLSQTLKWIYISKENDVKRIYNL